jgi:serpin B
MRMFGSMTRSRLGAASIAVCVVGGLLLAADRSAVARIEIHAPATDATQRLAARLFPLSVARGGGNTIISPLSLGVALHMAAGGANAATEKAFRESLGISGASTGDSVRNFGKLVRSVGSRDPKVTFRSVNGMWLATNARPVPAYLELLRNGFQARIETEDFSKPKAVKDINGWFARQTQQLIPNMISQIPADTRAILANALYFKGQWTTPFPAGATQPAPFHLADGKTVDVPMMRRSDDGFQYSETANYQAVRLAFGKGEFEIVVALPQNGVDPVKNAGELIAAASGQFSERPGRVLLPRLKLTAGGDMKPVLEAFGLKEVFSDSADFSRLAKSRVKFDQVIHRVALSWDEKGAEAAAGTAVVMTKTAALPVDRFEMNVDRPFVFILRHVKTGMAILVGLVNDPRQGSS